MYLYWAFTDPFLIVTPSTAQWNSHSCALDFAFGKAEMILNTSENVHRFSENTVPFYVGTTASKYLGSHGTGTETNFLQVPRDN